MAKFKGVGINPELPFVLTITLFLFLIGFVLFCLDIGSEFNFYSSKIVVDGQNIQEELHYKPDKSYHTLYRNFESEAYSNHLLDFGQNNYIGINNIECSSGNAYFRTYSGQCYNEGSSGQTISCYLYTENNEYGCTFGELLGFSKGKEYTINAEYEIHAENLFLIDGNYYIKFVVYSPNNHVKLNSKNFIVEGDVVKKNRYYSNENVILYIPYTEDISEFEIMELEDFEFDSEFKSLFNSFLLFFPGILFFLFWLIFGKENVYEQVPKELSGFPTERAFWEVAAYFNPPFFRIDKNFFAAVLLNFYNKKIIDIKEKNKEIYIKLNSFNGDDLERKIYNLLGEAESLLKDKIEKRLFLGGLTSKQKEKSFDGEYFNLKISMMDSELAIDFLEVRNYIQKEGKKYLYNNFSFVPLIAFLAIFSIILIKSYFGFIASFDLSYVIFQFFILFVISLVKGTLFSKYKENHYIEYQKWRAFKRYLKNSFSIKTATHKTVVIWNEYLVYATALGVPNRVIKELEANNLIDEKQVSMYNGVILASSSSFSSASGGAAGGGGFGGAGGGGVGGGGGGGR